MTARQFLRSVASVVLSATPRIYLLRLLLLSSLVCLLAVPFADLAYTEDTIVVVSISLALLLHHVCSVFVIHWVPALGDLGFTLAECTLVFLIIRPWSWHINPYYLKSLIILTGAIYLQIIALCIMLFFRIVVMVAVARTDGLKTLIQPFDFLAMSRGSGSQKRDRKSIVGGYTVWRTFFSNEPRTITVLRGVFAIATIGGLFAFLIHNIVLDPVSESGRTPQKIFRSGDFGKDFMLERDVHWRILAFRSADAPSWSNGAQIRDAVEVIPLWDTVDGLGQPPCTSKPNAELFSGEVFSYPTLEISDGYNAYDYIGSPSADVWPDLLITVNFTLLGINTTSLSNYRSRTVSIVVGLTDNTKDVITNTLPITMVPDLHVFGGVIPTIRQQFKQADFASFGLFSATRRFLLGNVPLLMPDPSSLVPRDNNTATLRLYMQSDPSDWFFMVDYREKSVWAGLSAVGGFWTALNGVFVFIFGTSLLMILFDAKPLSRFGLIHKFKAVKLDEYPQLMSEGQDDPGLVAYMRDHFIDLGPLRKKQGSSEDFEGDETRSQLEHQDSTVGKEREASPLMA